MKVKSILFFIYFLFAIASLVLLLIFAPEIKNKDSSNFEIITSEQDTTNGEDDIITNPNDETDEINNNGTESENEFATSIGLNLPKSITAYVGGTLEFDPECVVVKPAKMSSKVELDVDPTYNSEIANVKKNNFTLSFVGSGTYKLYFSVPGKNGRIKNSVKLIVQEKEELNIKQTHKTLYLNENTNLSDVFMADDLGMFSFKSNNLAIINNQILSPDCVMDSVTITASTGDEFYQVKYNFEFTVKDVPAYTIKFYEYTDMVEVDIHTQYVTIYYYVLNRDEGLVSQSSYAYIDDERVATIDFMNFNCVRIKIHQTGETNLKVYLRNNINVVANLKIVVN